MKSTKQQILEYLLALTEHFDFNFTELFTAGAISDEMHISRSLASQYLNELVKEKLVMKAGSRPVCFLHRKKMEELFKMDFQEEEFYDLEEIKDYVKSHYQNNTEYSDISGSDHSLAGILRSLSESVEYPPEGIPTMLWGEMGCGKKLLATTVYKTAFRKGSFPAATEMFFFDLTEENVKETEEIIFGNGEKKGLLEQYSDLFFIFGGCQNMGTLQKKLCDLMENRLPKEVVRKKEKGSIRYLFLCDKEPSSCITERLLKHIPIILRVPSFKEKSLEEREELVMHYIQAEGRRIKCQIYISAVVLRALINGEYEKNVTTLQNVIQVMCASARQRKQVKKGEQDHELKIHAYDLPKYLLRTMPIVTERNETYINTAFYKRNKEADQIQDHLNRMIGVFEGNQIKDDTMIRGKRQLELLNDYLSYEQRIPAEKIKELEASIGNILDVVVKKRYITLPGSFSSVLAKILYIHDIYEITLNKWEAEKQGSLEEILMLLRQHFNYESMIAEDISQLIQSNLERRMPADILIAMFLYLQSYNSQFSGQKIRGIIVCHGYSTASSIADAVNSMFQNCVFDSIDMPLSISPDKIRLLLAEHLSRMDTGGDMVVMVDTGSLEEILKNFDLSVNCNVGLINNVSTALALCVAEHILQNESLEEVLEKAAQASIARYKVFKRRKSDVILFTSESGLRMAQKMMEMFEQSFPEPAKLEFKVSEYTQLVAKGRQCDVFNNDNVLFVTGTSDPQIDNVTFVALEEIISESNPQIMRELLLKYLTLDQMEELLENLRKKFTLQNVVGYLSILNPTVLLDQVYTAVNILQKYLGYRFGGQTLIGIYIHVCCLVERLVTKTPITEYAGLDGFEENNGDFIKSVGKAFHTLLKTYNIEIPMSEIAYLHEFITADQQRKLNGGGSKTWERKRK